MWEAVCQISSETKRIEKWTERDGDGCVNRKEGWRSSEIIQRLLSAVLLQCMCVCDREREGDLVLFKVTHV